MKEKNRNSRNKDLQTLELPKPLKTPNLKMNPQLTLFIVGEESNPLH